MCSTVTRVKKRSPERGGAEIIFLREVHRRGGGALLGRGGGKQFCATNNLERELIQTKESLVQAPIGDEKEAVV